MNLDDLSRFNKLDRQDMLGAIDGLPAQLESAWALGGRLPLGEISGVKQIVIAGMGGSAIGADLLAAYAAPMSVVPITVWRNYDLPAYASGEQTLVIASSHSGNTEETLSAFEAAWESGAQLLAVTTGGELARRAEAISIPVWHFDHSGQPRAAVGFSFGLLLGLVSRLGLIPDPIEEFEEALQSMRSQQMQLAAGVPVVDNPAKRMAGQLMGRWPTILGAGLLAPVARRWRGQISELAKAVAQFEELPEADHNMVAGVEHPEALFAQTMLVFLKGSAQHDRNKLRVDHTHQLMMLEGFNTDIIQAAGDSRLAQQWTSLHFGDYTAFYLAMAYGVDPTPVEALEELKRRLSDS